MARMITDSAGIQWQIVDENTGRAIRVTPPPSKPASRRPTTMERYFQSAPNDPHYGYSPRVYALLRDQIAKALQDRGPGSEDAIRRFAFDRFSDLPREMVNDFATSWLRDPQSMGLSKAVC